MSDQPALIVGRAELPEVITVAEQARDAGQRIRAADAHDDIDDLKQRCLAFINSQEKGTPSPALAMAKTKLEEMVFWIRRHRERQA